MVIDFSELKDAKYPLSDYISYLYYLRSIVMDYDIQMGYVEKSPVLYLIESTTRYSKVCNDLIESIQLICVEMYNKGIIGKDYTTPMEYMTSIRRKEKIDKILKEIK